MVRLHAALGVDSFDDFECSETFLASNQRLPAVADGVAEIAELARRLQAPEPTFQMPPANQTLPHEKAQRRINNRRMKEELRVELRYPDFEQGLRAI